MSFAVVLAGGGCRTAWSVGMINELRADLEEPCEWAGVSAGSCMAVGLAAYGTERMMERFLALAAANRRNLYPERLGRGPVFPHERIYRDTVAAGLAAGGLERLRAAAPVRLLLACIAPGAPLLPSLWGALRGYRARKRAGILHGPDAPPPGFAREVVTAQDLAGPRDIENAVLASSAAPLVTRLPRASGRVYVDGGFVENVPVRALSPGARAGKVLVLLTRPAPRSLLPETPRLLYLAPERELPIAKWDYTSPAKLEASYATGRSDARRWRERIVAWSEAGASAASTAAPATVAPAR